MEAFSCAGLHDVGALLRWTGRTGFNGDDEAACATRQRTHIAVSKPNGPLNRAFRCS